MLAGRDAGAAGVTNADIERLEKTARRSDDEDAMRRRLWRGAIAALDDEDEWVRKLAREALAKAGR